jgi:hypothetical protein
VTEPVTETVLEDEAPARVSASTVAAAPHTLTPLPGETPAAEATDRRPHRRRGRRGGRRGRAGGESPPAAPEGE